MNLRKLAEDISCRLMDGLSYNDLLKDADLDYLDFVGLNHVCFNGKSLEDASKYLAAAWNPFTYVLWKLDTNRLKDNAKIHDRYTANAICGYMQSSVLQECMAEQNRVWNNNTANVEAVRKSMYMHIEDVFIEYLTKEMMK